MSRLPQFLSRLRRIVAELDSTLRLLSWKEYKLPRSHRYWWRIP